MEKFKLIPTVEVKTDGFSAEVIGMYEMPYQQVLGALTTPHGPAQMVAMLNIFKLALIDQKKVNDLDLMSFNEMAEILGQWTFKSTVDSVEDGVKGGDGKSPLDPDKIIAMLADPTLSLDDVMDELNNQLEGYDVDISVDGVSFDKKKKSGFFGFLKGKKKPKK